MSTLLICSARVRGTSFSLGWVTRKCGPKRSPTSTYNLVGRATFQLHLIHFAKASDEILDINKAARTDRDVTAELMADLQERGAARIEKPRRVEARDGALWVFKRSLPGVGRRMDASGWAMPFNGA